MKETIRTASVTEIYNNAIEELKEERKSIQVELNKKNAKKVAFVLLKTVGIVLLIFGTIAAMASFSGNAPTPQFRIFMFIIFGLAPLGTGVMFIQKANKSKDDLSQLLNKIKIIDKEINRKRIKKRSLLEAEEVIVAKDIKTESSNLNEKNLTEPYEQSKRNFDEKVCPMCAETIKHAAKICRYCGHKFEKTKDND